MNTDQHGQTQIRYRNKQNEKKALIELLGLCEGLTADQKLNANELSCLSGWLDDNQELLGNDPDYVDLKHQLKDIFADGIVTDDELDDTCSLIHCIIEERQYHYDADEAVQHLLAMLHGVLADSALSEKEVRRLGQWLARTQHIRDKWPANILAERIEQTLSDNIITPEELGNLMDALIKIAGGTFAELGTITGVVTAAYELDDCGSPVDIQGRTFVLTGAFLSGSRKACQERIHSHGGLTLDSLTQQVDYLVVGVQASRDWINSSHGRKIQKANEMRAKGHHIRTVSEQRWLAAMK